MQKLIDCPFCGEQGDLYGTKKTTGNYWVQCFGCKAETDKFLERVAAEQAWNDKKIHPAKND